MTNNTVSPVYKYYFTAPTQKKSTRPMSSEAAVKQERALILQRIAAEMGM